MKLESSRRRIGSARRSRSTWIGGSQLSTRKSRLMMAAVGAVAALVILSGCTSSPASDTSTGNYTPGKLTKAYSGTTISVLLPPWGTFPQSELKKFTSETGIKVKMQTLAWDSIHDKVVTAEAAGQAPADVVEMDWTWVAQFGAAGWYEPLGKYMSKAQLSDSVGASQFVYKGQQIGMPYSLDFRGTEVNMTMLKKAGISTPPKTWNDLLKDAEAVKNAGVVQYPLGYALKVLEGAVTPWFALVRGSGGQILTAKGQPAFAQGEIGQAAFQFIRDAYQKGLIDPGAIGLTEEQVSTNFAAGQSAVLISASPNSIPGYTDPTQSKVAKNELQFVHMPGQANDTGPTVGLEEALSIPKASKNKEAAAQFITWWMQTPQQLAAQSNPNMGLLPPSRTALQKLESADTLQDSSTIMKLSANIQPIFPDGGPTWYSKFVIDSAATIQSVALGHTTPAAGIAKLATQTKQLAAQGQ